jgi:hypothetical protein
MYNKLMNQPCQHGKKGGCSECEKIKERRRYKEAYAHILRCRHCGNTLDNCMCTVE